MNNTEEEVVLNAVPVYCYKLDAKTYQWPRTNRCVYCLVGKFKLIKGQFNTYMVCKVCEVEYHIPHQA